MMKACKYISISISILFLSILTKAQPSATGKFVIEPYIQQVTDTSFSLLWETAEPGWDKIYLAVAEYNVFTPSFVEVACDDQNNLYHNIRINGLKPGGRYFYKTVTITQSGDTICSEVTPFTIPDYSKMPVSFAVIGDTQGNPLIWGRLADLIYRERPSFIVHVGDMVQYGPHKDDWVDEFFRPARNLFRFYPIYPAIGNHEMNHDWFYRYFELPDPEWFYTVRKGNVLFIFANTNRDILPGSEQYKQLEKILASSNDTWKVMVHHHPVYTSDEHAYGNTWYQLAVHGDPNEIHLKSLYETYGVDVVFNGHIHCYERTWPIFQNRIDKVNGVTYVTLGGGGGGLDKAAANKTWYAAKTRNTHHFLNVSIAGNTLYAQAIDTTGVVFDSWTIEKQSFYTRLNAPLISSERQYFIDSTVAVISNLNQQGGIITVKDNNEYCTYSNKEINIPINDSKVISACIVDGEQKSAIIDKKFEKLTIFPVVKKADKKVKASYYEGEFIWLPDFNREKAKLIFSLDSVTLTAIQPRVKDHFAVDFTGSFSIPETDVYRFMLESYDGSRLIIDGKEVINNDGVHYEIKKETFLALEKGIHRFEIQYFDFTRRETLNLLVGKQTGSMYSFNKLVR